MDDYLVLPPLRLEAGKAYIFSFKAIAKGYTSAERIEVVGGKAPAADALTSVLVGPTTVVGDAVSIRATVIPESTGTYYLAVHCISDANLYGLYVDDIEVSAGQSVEAPGTVTAISVVPDGAGALTASVRFKAPTVNLASSPLKSITAVTVSRGGREVKRFDNPAIGAELSFVDNLPKAGSVTYTFVASNAAGEGKSVESESVYVGFQEPAAVESATITESASTPGEVTLNWTPVGVDIAGKTYPSGSVTYTVCSYENFTWNPIANLSNIKETKATFRAVEDGKQQFVQFAVFPCYGTTMGQSAITSALAVGTPFNEMEESFPDGTRTYPWAADSNPIDGIEGDGYATWSVYKDTYLDNMHSQDGDNGMAAMYGPTLESSGMFYSGKIKVPAEKPTLSLFTYAIDTNPMQPHNNLLNVYIREVGSRKWTLLNGGNNVVGGNSAIAKAGEWGNLVLPLDAYAGKVVQIGFHSVVKSYSFTFVDNVRLGTLPVVDLVAEEIAVPANVKAGEDFTVGVTVSNVGIQPAKEFTIELYADGKPVGSKSFDSLANGKKVATEFACNMNPSVEKPVAYTAKVVCPTDENPDNNNSGKAVVTPVRSTYPGVSNLRNNKTGEGVVLTWSLPDLGEKVPELITDDFEAYEPFATEIDGWTFIDEDNKPVNGAYSVEIPGIVKGETCCSFMVLDVDHPTFNPTFAAHSGHQYIASFYRDDDKQVSDWAISPRLSGQAQTVTFYAKSHSDTYMETIEVYAGEGTDLEAYAKGTPVLATTQVPNEWTLYSVEVPAGTTHVAIHSCGKANFFLYIDDFTYETLMDASDLEILGYDIYRDTVKINPSPVKTLEFVDTTAPTENHDYAVVTLYNKGVSKPVVTILGLGGIDSIEGDVKISTGPRSIFITGAQGKAITVQGINGITYFSAEANAADTRVEVPAGVYVVTVGASTAKIMVR